ncbi:MAG TPA: bifunctional diaminohydroxyphosphoribosylaminopyrimidine deaminase/5-amino-6-(5-phosphoribosylamino)uracil reductase RibD [Acidimicrobiales bacterium]|nr:bifunctional diaminohydroxyphosphoribosylaminopyrimidine deaminase/5-amino-6-(5-phosphoribosylamino)uracil reductase RibD [Acidimicrobiales bacterium]
MRSTATPIEEAAMRRAVVLAARGLGATSPNPVVGCVVLDTGGRVTGEGWHQSAGGPHAEVAALAAAGAGARGGTAVVTLEPCAHTGRTPPCVDALLAAGVARVVYAVADPTARAGGGAARLAAAGVEVVADVGAGGAEAVNEAWLTRARTGRPHVHWKFAATLDGRSAAPDGTSRWISSPDSRAEVHDLRRRVDAVMVGVGTVLADDPSLTARGPDGVPSGRQPLRVVVDSVGRTPSDAAVRDAAAPTWVATAADVGGDPAGRVDLHRLLAVLADRGVVSVLLEGGPTLAGAMLAAGLVDRVTAYVAPALLGAGAAALGPAGVTTLADAFLLQVDATGVVGGDIRVTGRPRPGGGRRWGQGG